MAMALIDDIDIENGKTATSLQKPNAKMTDEERAALADKLDEQLDDFIDSLEKRGYTEGWPEDRWEEEMAKHPFFMKEPPKPGDDLHPMLEGIQQLKYDPLENTLEDLASTYKNDGNFDMKNKKYRMAIFSYTEGINQKCQNDELNATLYNNRSAAHFFLKNYRSSFLDGKKALNLNADYEKAAYRIAQCSLHMKNYDECIELCNKYAEKFGQNDKIIELRKKARETHLTELRDKRKRQTEIRKKGETLKRTIDELKTRGVKFEEQLPSSRYEDLIRPGYIPLEEYPIQMTSDNGLRWPSIFCYPEYECCDFQQQLTDNIVLYEILCELFAERMPQDTAYRYKPDSVNVYFENRLKGTVHQIDVRNTIKQITSDKNFLVGRGVLTFYVVVKGSEAEKSFMGRERNKLNITQY